MFSRLLFGCATLVFLMVCSRDLEAWRTHIADEVLVGWEEDSTPAIN